MNSKQAVGRKMCQVCDKAAVSDCDCKSQSHSFKSQKLETHTHGGECSGSQWPNAQVELMFRYTNDCNKLHLTNLTWKLYLCNWSVLPSCGHSMMSKYIDITPCACVRERQRWKCWLHIYIYTYMSPNSHMRCRHKERVSSLGMQ